MGCSLDPRLQGLILLLLLPTTIIMITTDGACVRAYHGDHCRDVWVKGVEAVDDLSGERGLAAAGGAGDAD